MLESFFQAHQRQQTLGLLPRRCTAISGDELRHHHILKRREFRQQMMRLIHKADRVAAQTRAFAVGQRRGGSTVDVNLAGSRRFEKTRNMQ